MENNFCGSCVGRNVCSKNEYWSAIDSQDRTCASQELWRANTAVKRGSKVPRTLNLDTVLSLSPVIEIKAFEELQMKL